MNLTEEQREWRREMAEKLAALTNAIHAINGPYKQTVAALAALKAVGETAIDDEDIGPCAFCLQPIWVVADDDYVTNDCGERFCVACASRWNEKVKA